MTTRFVQIFLGKTTRCQSLTRGTPQGRILPPLIWNTVFNSLLDGIEGVPGINPKGYADDGMFLVIGKDPDIQVHFVQPSINLAVNWGEENGLRFSPMKTLVILFHRENKLAVKGNL